MASPSGSANGGIIGTTNKTSFGKNKITSGTASGPGTLTTQAGTRLVDTLIVAGGGGGGSTSGGSGGGGGAGGVRPLSNLEVGDWQYKENTNNQSSTNAQLEDIKKRLENLL